MEDDSESPGWQAIDEALDGLYNGVEPKHWGAIVPYALGGPDPLTGLSAYQSGEQSEVWHFVTHGFSDLHEKESEDPDVSGFGFELTFRLRTSNLDDDAPWVWNFLQNLARYVFETGRTFGPGHTMPLNGPIRSDSDTKIVAITFILDPELGAIATPHGGVSFLQVVGLTQDELDATLYWNARSFAELIRESNPLLVTDLARGSYLADEVFACEVAERSAKEGASAEGLNTDEFRFRVKRFPRSCVLTLGAFLTNDLRRRLRGRIPFGRPFEVLGESAAIQFEPAEVASWAVDGETLRLRLSPEAFDELEQILVPRAGTHRLRSMDRFSIVIEKTEIKNNDGEVTDVIG